MCRKIVETVDAKSLPQSAMTVRVKGIPTNAKIMTKTLPSVVTGTMLPKPGTKSINSFTCGYLNSLKAKLKLPRVVKRYFCHPLNEFFHEKLPFTKPNSYSDPYQLYFFVLATRNLGLNVFIIISDGTFTYPITIKV